MAFRQNVNEVNKLQVVYISGDEFTDGSIRLDFNSGTIPQTEERIEGVWQLTALRQTFDRIVTTEDGGVINNAGNFVFI